MHPLTHKYSTGKKPTFAFPPNPLICMWSKVLLYLLRMAWHGRHDETDQKSPKLLFVSSHKTISKPPTQGHPQSRVKKTTATMTGGQLCRNNNGRWGSLELGGFLSLVEAATSACFEARRRDLSKGGAFNVVGGVHPSPQQPWPGNSIGNGVGGEKATTDLVTASSTTTMTMTMTTLSEIGGPEPWCPRCWWRSSMSSFTATCQYWSPAD